ncbi:MAG TPA: hypothetical protein VKT77_19005 [Chthonomonadaceae bacterium]|nr:hypothetical protein [Chthonomonadaceae bacterium]
MKFRVSPANRPARVVAAIILLGFSAGGMLALPIPIGLVPMALAGLAVWVLARETIGWMQERWRYRDRYDLRLIDNTRPYEGPSRDSPAAEPQLPTCEAEDGDAVYCHRCATSMPAHVGICPYCGSPLGH